LFEFESMLNPNEPKGKYKEQVIKTNRMEKLLKIIILLQRFNRYYASRYNLFNMY